MAHYKGAAREMARATQLTKKRKQEQLEAEFRKKQIEEQMQLQNIDKKFSTYSESKINDKNAAVGLMTMAEMKARQDEEIRLSVEYERRRNESKKISELKIRKMGKDEQNRKIKKLSFDIEDDVEDDDEDKINNNNHSTVKRMKKDESVDTSYLPDRNKEQIENQIREQLKREWMEQQKAIKAEEIDVTFSYWDGVGHRFNITVKKGNTIQEFLQKALTEILRNEFTELKNVSVDQLMYIKEDLILPHYYSFYDFIVSKARGKSGPLFQFNVQDDIRLLSDATVEKEESHAGKVVLRSWYERNKHIFPGNRWEAFDPLKKYGTYTFKN